ncbi:MAG: hypothetical protein AAGD25_04790 [Cyanobacteria bacterium P01_F01_bin.150]
MASPSHGALIEENRTLQNELNRLEDLLSQSRAERDEIGIKYNAVSERVRTDISSLANFTQLILFM